MIIKSVKNGKAVEYKPEEKFEIALKLKLPEHAPENETWWVKEGSVEFTRKSFTPNGQLLRNMFQNNLYEAEGSCLIVSTNLEKNTDCVKPPFKKSFKIVFKDELDANGMPTVSLSSLEFI